MSMSDRMKKAVAAGNMFELARQLDEWSTEELQALLTDINTHYGECMERLHEKFGEMIFKPEVFFNDKAAQVVKDAAHKVEIDVLGTCSEMSAVAMMILEERGIKIEFPEDADDVKKDKLDKVTMVHDMSRANIGTVPPTKVVPQKKRKTSIKHKKRDAEIEGEV